MSYKSDITKIKNELEEIRAKLDKENNIDFSKMTKEELEQRIAELTCRYKEMSLSDYYSMSEEDREKLRKDILKELKEKYKEI